MMPGTLNDNIERSAAIFNLTKSQFLAAAFKQPALFYRNPEALSSVVERNAAQFNIRKDQFIVAALRQPQLFYQKPETLSANVRESAVLLGLTETQFIAAALKQPSLFYQKPTTLSSKKPLIGLVCEALGDSRPFDRLFDAFPACVTYSRSRLHACYVVAKLGLKRGAFPSIARKSNRTISAIIVSHFEKQIERTGRGARALQVMHAQGLITTLPEGITPIERPPRRQRGTQGPSPLPPP